MAVKREAMEVRDASADYVPQVAESTVPEGYRQTEVWVIPEGWKVLPIDALCAHVLDCHHSTPTWTTSGAVVIRNQNIREGKLDLSNPSFTDEETFVERTRRAVPTFGDLVITREAPMGLVCEVPKGLRCCLGQRMVLLRPSHDVVESRYLLYSLLSGPVQRSISVAGGVGSTVSNLRIPALRNIKIPTPEHSEQRAIATALSDADALLEGLDRLVAKKRDLKQAAMQQLLTGQARLPGFEGEWRTVRLGDYVTFLKNGTNSRAELLNDGVVRYLHYGDIHASDASALEPDSLPFLPPTKAKTLDRLQDGDLIFADASEDMDGVGKSVELERVGESEVVAGLHTIAARFDNSILANGFKAYLQFCPEFIAALRRLAAGTKVYATTRSHIAGIEMRLPDIEEQKAIAAIFQDMDTELEALEQRRAKTAALKQAMMQELLTGRTRLVDPMLKECANG